MCQGLGQVLKNKQISLNTKKRILKCYVWSTLMYVCEGWNISQAMQERLEAVEIWFLKRMLNISWMDRMTDEAILRKASTGRALMTMITTRQLRSLGHVNRKETIEYLAITGKIKAVFVRRKIPCVRQTTRIAPFMRAIRTLTYLTLFRSLISICKTTMVTAITTHFCFSFGT